MSQGLLVEGQMTSVASFLQNASFIDAGDMSLMAKVRDVNTCRATPCFLEKKDQIEPFWAYNLRHEVVQMPSHSKKKFFEKFYEFGDSLLWRRLAAGQKFQKRGYGGRVSGYPVPYPYPR